MSIIQHPHFSTRAIAKWEKCLSYRCSWVTRQRRSPFSLAGRRAGDEGVLSVKFVDPAIKFDFAIGLTFSLDLMKFMIKCFMAIIKSFNNITTERRRLLKLFFPASRRCFPGTQNYYVDKFSKEFYNE
jgi:hypothetical protein